MKYTLQLIASLTVLRKLTEIILHTATFLGRIRSNFVFRSHVKNCSNSICHYSTEIKYGDKITIGRNSRIGKNCTLGAKGGISIGSNVVISKYVTIETAGLNLTQGPPYNSHISKPIVIEDGVWIGTQCVVLNGVTIGTNSIIGAGTIITKNIPPNSIIVGASNRIIQ
jgi:maltose O-acetyltransferase